MSPFIALFRSSHPEMFCKKGVLRNFAKFTGNVLCQSLIFNKVVSFRAATLLKEGLWHRCFLENFVTFLKTPFYYKALLVAASKTCDILYLNLNRYCSLLVLSTLPCKIEKNQNYIHKYMYIFIKKNNVNCNYYFHVFITIQPTYNLKFTIQ